MSMKKTEKKEVRRIEGYKNTQVVSGDNKHGHNIRLFLGLSSAVVCFMLLFAGVASAAPAFYDDFSDGKFQDRTGTDPWGRSLPEWNIGRLPTSYFDASDGWLTRIDEKGSAYQSMEGTFLSPGNEYFKLSFDFILQERTYAGCGDPRLGVGIYTENGDYYWWQRRNDEHTYFDMHVGGVYYKLDGLWAPTGAGGKGLCGPYDPYFTLGEWHHVEIERHLDHKMYVFEDGLRAGHSWTATKPGGPPKSWEDEDDVGYNVELWDNPGLYHNIGGTGADVTVEGNFVKIKLEWLSGEADKKGWGIDNISFTAYGASDTGAISGTVKDTYDITIANATVSDGTRSATTDETGVYTLTGVPSGTYTVTSTKTGYQDASVANVVVSEEAPTEVDLTLEDTFSPYTSGIRPAKAATGVSRDTNIVVHIIDDGSGVDQSSIVMTVEGTPVSPTITGTANDYIVTYTPPTPFEYEHVVDVTIAAQDLATPANVMTTESYAFTILSEQQSLIITNVNVASITTNTATITWATNEEADTKVTYDTNPASLGTVWKNNSVLTKTHSITLTRLDDDKTYYYEVYSTDSTENTANSIIYNFITLPVLPGNGTVLIQAQDDVTDNRLKEASSDTVLGSSNYIDIGRIDSEGNYRDVIWFDLSQLNSTDVIKDAKLSLFWYYVEDTRNKSTTVEIYRPVDWAETYVTWNSRTGGVAWNNLGGDWYDKNIVAQGDTPYAAVTLPLGAPDNAYHEFDVTELVQSYVSGLYENTGFFIKANEVSDSYIAFRSSDWTNADERPKLVVSYSSGDVQQKSLSGAVTSPDSAGISGANVTLATLEGTVINTTQTDSNGNYSFTEISAGTYNLTVTKPRFWPAADNITVTTGNTEDVMLWLKGDLNLNGTQADSGDLLMMGYAATGGLTPDWKFDLNGNGEDACAGDLLMLEDAAAGKIELW